jgi:hypothetical protein
MTATEKIRALLMYKYRVTIRPYQKYEVFDPNGDFVIFGYEEVLDEVLKTLDLELEDI